MTMGGPEKTTRVPKDSVPSFRNGHLPKVEDLQRLRTLTEPHVQSFDYFLEIGLPNAIRDLPKQELACVDPKDASTLDITDTTTVKLWVENVRVHKPTVEQNKTQKKLFPRECRERNLMYAGNMTGDFHYQIIKRRNGIEVPSKENILPGRDFGKMPIMVLSRACHLHGTTPVQLVKLREEHNEFGGYFIVSGIERCVRLLQVPRRNYATAIQRNNYKNRGNTYTDLGVAMRCSRYNGDMSSITNTVHYLTTGGATLRFVARKQEFLVPVILLLRALSSNQPQGADIAAGGSSTGVTDEELYRRIVQGDDANTFLVARAGLLLQEARSKYPEVNTPEECLRFLGSRFRRLSQRPETTSDIDVGHFIIDQFVLIHLPKYNDKLECLLFMLRKLYSFAAGDCGVDNADSLQTQEILLPGHLLSTFVKEKFDEFLQALRLGLVIEMRKDFEKIMAHLSDAKYWGKMVDRFSNKSSGSIGKKVQHFLSTGNIVSTTGLDLMQVSGYTIVAERLNFLRYCAHFRSVHRGQFFMEMKTTAVRKLLPDQWGFLCPVHTPDGGPCGLLSHIALKAKIMTYSSDKTGEGPQSLATLLIALGVHACEGSASSGESFFVSNSNHLPVMIDGRVVGFVTPARCKEIVAHLRELKVSRDDMASLEAAYLPPGNPGSPYPGLYLFLCAARLIRPVLQRATGKLEMIGPLEQSFMDVACLDEDIREGITTHQELDPTNMLSLIANLTPFSDQNQSPRNMYQCQMGKQTMGTPCHSLPFRPDNKLYKLQTPQAPIVQTKIHGDYKMDEYPNGTNAVVAVLSYTGFDMEDAMILNKSAYERGMAHASVYKTIQVDLQEEAKLAGVSSTGAEPRLKFANKPRKVGPMRRSFQEGNEENDEEFFHSTLGPDGLPAIGDRIEYGDPLYCIIDSVTNRDKVGRHKEREVAYVQSVRALAMDNESPAENRVSLTLRFPRNPLIGDKFSSRHGQKGVLSILWPQADMPFSESGISPDIIINPHAFPSRMTIGMLVESMAGKSGALHGHFQDATPFQFHESGDQVSVDYFGKELQAAGYNYYGSEALYSGVTGCVMQADLYIGVVFYQRLRHMVSDKYQVRATGPTNELTRQPIKGRKKGGGIRLGEMERDSLLSHGAAFLLQDRLINCSDKHHAYVCGRCGDMLMPTTERTVQTAGMTANEVTKLRLYCRSPACIKAVNRDDGNDVAVEPVVLPYVYRYLVNELAGMNIKVKMELE